MQLQCSYCSKMFVVNKEAALAGMYAIHNEDSNISTPLVSTASASPPFRTSA